MAKKIISALFYLLLIGYALLALELFFRFSAWGQIDFSAARRMNLIPLHTILNYLSGSAFTAIPLVVFNNLVGNVLVFFPYGLYLQMFRKNRRWPLSFLQIILTSLLIEVIQYAFHLGAADVDDLLLNCLGGLLGTLFFAVLLKCVKKQEKARYIVMVISLLFCLAVLPITLFLPFRILLW